MLQENNKRYSMPDSKHICVCICTFKRVDFLTRLLEGLRLQETQGLFTYSIVVTDNDRSESAKPTVLQFAVTSGISTCYCVEPDQNIALARNRAVRHAHGDFIAFIDDDEFPTQTWLLTLFKAWNIYGCDGVLGPVKPHFDEVPPSWVVKGGFYDRPSYPTGFLIDWKKGRTGNVLLKSSLFDKEEAPFRHDFLTGEDQDFFRRMIQKGHSFVWCHEAVAYEVVPPIRWKRSFMLKRALLRGKISLIHPTTGTKDILKSLVAVPTYLLALPFLVLLGQHLFMKYLIKLFDHTGRLLVCIGVNPVASKYVTK